MTFVVRWQTTREQVTVVTNDGEVTRAQYGNTDAREGAQVFVCEGRSCVELARGSAARATLRLRRPDRRSCTS